MTVGNLDDTQNWFNALGEAEPSNGQLFKVAAIEDGIHTQRTNIAQHQRLSRNIGLTPTRRCTRFLEATLVNLSSADIHIQNVFDLLITTCNRDLMTFRIAIKDIDRLMLRGLAR